MNEHKQHWKVGETHNYFIPDFPIFIVKKEVICYGIVGFEDHFLIYPCGFEIKCKAPETHERNLVYRLTFDELLEYGIIELYGGEEMLEWWLSQKKELVE